MDAMLATMVHKIKSQFYRTISLFITLTMQLLLIVGVVLISAAAVISLSVVLDKEIILTSEYKIPMMLGIAAGAALQTLMYKYLSSVQPTREDEVNRIVVMKIWISIMSFSAPLGWAMLFRKDISDAIVNLITKAF